MALIRQDVLIDVRSGTDVKGLVKLRNELQMLQKAGLKNASGLINNVDNRIRKLGVNVKAATRTFQRFRMELLSVMFLGMGLAAAMNGLLQPAFQMVGIFEIWSNTLGILFLPIAIALLDLLLPISDAIMSMPEPIQLAIGAFVLFLAVIGKLLFLFGALGLGIQGLATLFPTVFTGGIMGTLSTFASWLAGFFTVGVLGIFALIAVALVGFWLAWKENFGNIKSWVAMIWDGIKKIFSGIGNIIGGIKDLIVGLFSGDTDLLISGFKRVVGGIIQIGQGLFQFFVGLVATIGLSLFRIVKGVWDSIVGLVSRLFSWISEKISQFVNWVSNKVKEFGRFLGFGGSVDVSGAGGSGASNQTLNFAPTVNISTSGGVDSGKIKNSLNQDFARELGRLSRR